MSETLKEMSNKNIFVRIIVNAVDKKTKDLEGISEMTALYVAMNWINTDECSEIMAYATDEPTDRERIEQVEEMVGMLAEQLAKQSLGM